METKAANQDALQTSVKFVKGVGEHRARLLGKLGIKTVLDVMEFFPRSYISRKVNPALGELRIGERVALTVMISWVDTRSTARGRSILNIGVSDGQIGLICSWFSYPPSYEKLFQPGRTVWITGTLGEFNGQLQILHPDFELLDASSEELDFWREREVLPVYPLTEGITQNYLRKLVLHVFSLYAAQITETLPAEIIAKHHFPERKAALQKMHFALDLQTADSVRARFAYEELFYSQILWARHRANHDVKASGIVFENKRQLTTALKQKLPFALTGAQMRVTREIFADMTSTKQMSRLVQGDVGSGKTIVTLFAMLLAVENGYQAALMAPTEILADQHFHNFQKLLEGMPVNLILLKGGNYKGKVDQKKQISSGEAQLIIGTHALIQKDVEFCKLGFIAIDEQHRFGVEQRALLARREPHPELLYLSATPIPRSLALTLYGDMEVSQIDEMPPNRKEVITYIRSDRKLDSVYQAVRMELQKGRQAYFVCPLVEESDKVDLVDAERLHQHLSKKVFPEFPCQLIHGRMANASKDEIMRSFKAGEIKVLISTTVIEVGVDVANATVMVVEHAERFGLAQLHQLRGRVGRGADQAFCYLIEHQPLSSMARERLATMSRTNDGFAIAEKDLELRGPGEMFGHEQSGMPQFRFANLVRDQIVLRQAREDAFEIVRSDPDLTKDEHALIKKMYQAKYSQKEELILY